MKENIVQALVVDDNEVNTIVLANMLELFDINVDQANCGLQALTMVQDKEYDIIFLDHVMPKMDGVQTTKAIRELAIHNKIIIIALTSSISDEIRKQYRKNGANDVYSKPLGLMELAAILKHWCPQLSVQEVSALEKTIRNNDDSVIKALVYEINEIDYNVGLRYAVGDPKNYINILKVSLKDIKTCLNLVKHGFESRQPNIMHIGVHNMKSVFANIGAMELADLARDLEQVLPKQDILTLEFYYHYFTPRISDFYEKLEAALEKYNKVEIRQEEIPSLPMTGEEYEHSLTNAIYYIKRFDYVAILEELELLIKRGRPEYHTELKLALAELKDFQYENTLHRIAGIKKEMDQDAISAEAD
ncbi:MAG: response regulator receiver protein [Herbinix sp.]|jgi:CheY-like chemotaxis protein|nr:response regulator receiver protein [Herbinix sp.]